MLAAGRPKQDAPHSTRVMRDDVMIVSNTISGLRTTPELKPIGIASIKMWIYELIFEVKSIEQPSAIFLVSRSSRSGGSRTKWLLLLYREHVPDARTSCCKTKEEFSCSSIV